MTPVEIQQLMAVGAALFGLGVIFYGALLFALHKPMTPTEKKLAREAAAAEMEKRETKFVAKLARRAAKAAAKQARRAAKADAKRAAKPAPALPTMAGQAAGASTA